MKLPTAVALVIAVLAALVASPSWGTGAHHVPIIIKPPVVVPPPPVVVPPPPAVVAPPPPAPVVVTPPPATASSAQPASQPSGGGGGSALGWYVMAGVAVYFSAVVYSHWIWCAEDDRKPEKERRCYRPLTHGLPEYQ